MLPVVAFVIVCLLNSVLALALKKACQLLLPQKYYPFASEFCCTFIVVANVFENGNMIESYGMTSFALTLFLLIWIYMNLFDAFANPLSTFDQVWNKKKPFWEGVAIVVCQVAGGCLGGRFIILLWGYMQLTNQHISRSEFLSQTCQSTNQVLLWQGMAVEMLFTVILRVIASFVTGKSWERATNSFASVVAVVIGLEWTGSMINPALATAMTYNCENHPFYEHVLVYWVAPFTGSILSDFIEDFLHGPGWRDKDQTIPGGQQAVTKTTRKRKTKKSTKAKKNNNREPVGSSQGKNGTGVSPKRRKRKDANNNNSKRKTNVGV
ncbi:aquaporin-11-like isoform X2 [Apostichopus japonicus]|uniref:aquaporin-11-like isoform X2 n=1 Tax=Stichopus japonicus TaxID=307972 RepID=UPI003AB59C40